MLQARGAQGHRPGDQVEDVAGAQHHRHDAEKPELTAGSAAPDHQNAQGDDQGQIDRVEQCFHDCLHESVSFLNRISLKIAPFPCRALPCAQDGGHPLQGGAQPVKARAPAGPGVDGAVQQGLDVTCGIQAQV